MTWGGSLVKQNKYFIIRSGDICASVCLSTDCSFVTVGPKRANRTSWKLWGEGRQSKFEAQMITPECVYVETRSFVFTGSSWFQWCPRTNRPTWSSCKFVCFFFKWHFYLYQSTLYILWIFFFLSQGTEGIRGRQGLQGDKGDDVSCSFMHLYKVIYIYSYYIQLHTYNCWFFFLGCSGTKGWARKSRGKRRYCKWPVHIHWA